MGFDKISLTSREAKALKDAEGRYVDEKPVHARLLRFQLVIRETSSRPGEMPVPTGRLTISENGIDYLAARRKELIEKWVPYAITTAISIASAVISLIALLSETGLIELPKSGLHM